MVARIWKGKVRLQDAEEYTRYIDETGMAEYTATPGNRGAWMLRRDQGELAEFTTLSFWDSLAAIEAFAGAEDPEAAVYYPEDERFLVEQDDRVLHYEIVSEATSG